MVNHGRCYMWPLIVSALNKTELSQDMFGILTQIKKENENEV